MALLLALAATGGVVRFMAPNPSVARDVGTLMLVLWLPVVGNLIGYLSRKIPRAAPPPTDFPPGAPFLADLEVSLQRLSQPAGSAQPAPADGLATVIVGRRGFTVRYPPGGLDWLPGRADAVMSLQLLRPGAALAHLQAGTKFHLLVGHQPVAKGGVVRVRS